MTMPFRLVPQSWAALFGLALLAAVSRAHGQPTSERSGTTVPANGGVVSTLAGKAGSQGSTDGMGKAARFYFPTGIGVDAMGTVYVADYTNSTIRKITTAGVVSTLAGLAGSKSSTDGPGAAARFNYPSGVTLDTAGTAYIADQYNHTIRKIMAGVVSTLAGTAGDMGDIDGTGAVACFAYPSNVAVDAAGTVYVGDLLNHTIRKITAAGVVSTLAGSAGSIGSTDGMGTMARFCGPKGIAVDVMGTVYVADNGNHTIRKITAAGMVSTLAGSVGSAGSVDGPGATARFNGPSGVAVDAAGAVYVADQKNHTIRKITADGVVNTLAGRAHRKGSADGIGTAARFNWPLGIAVDAAGTVYVADTENHTIRVIK